MKKIITRRVILILLLASSAVLTVCRVGAADVNLFGTNMPPLEFHGFVSQGFLATTKYNYLGDNTKGGSFQFTEAGLNASFNPLPRTRIMAQAFMFDIGNIGKYQPVLDYASAEYTFNDYIGIRGGRIRRPQGIYNEVIDVDLARTSILLPQGIYDARWRDFYANLDGGEIFGNLPLSKAGDLSYEIYSGIVRPSNEGGLAELVRNQLPPGSSLAIAPSTSLGAQLWWDTPLAGLRAGAGFFHVFDANSTLNLNLPPPPFGQGRISTMNKSVVDTCVISLDYEWKNWTFQSEYLRTWQRPGSIFDSWYASVDYRFTKWFQAGTYYTEYYPNIHDRNGSQLPTHSDGFQKDAALSLRFDLTRWWIFKLEGHYIRGTALLDDNADNPVRNDQGWFMLMFKTTFSF